MKKVTEKNKHPKQKGLVLLEDIRTWEPTGDSIFCGEQYTGDTFIVLQMCTCVGQA